MYTTSEPSTWFQKSLRLANEMRILNITKVVTIHLKIERTRKTIYCTFHDEINIQLAIVNNVLNLTEANVCSSLGEHT